MVSFDNELHCTLSTGLGPHTRVTYMCEVESQPKTAWRTSAGDGEQGFESTSPTARLSSTALLQPFRMTAVFCVKLPPMAQTKLLTPCPGALPFRSGPVFPVICLLLCLLTGSSAFCMQRQSNVTVTTCQPL